MSGFRIPADAEASDVSAVDSHHDVGVLAALGTSASSLLAIVSAESAVSRLRPDNVRTEDPALLGSVRPQMPLAQEHVEGLKNLRHEGLQGIVAVAARHRDVRFSEPRLEVSDLDSPDLDRNRLQDAVAGFA